MPVKRDYRNVAFGVEANFREEDLSRLDQTAKGCPARAGECGSNRVVAATASKSAAAQVQRGTESKVRWAQQRMARFLTTN